jgi:hypothetical protein
MIRLIKSFFCKHDYEFIRNLYGDEIIYFGYKRSMFGCKKCDKLIFKDELEKE